MIPTKFQVHWPVCSGEEAKIDFQECSHGGNLSFPIVTILAFSFTSYPESYQVSMPFGSGEKRKTDFQDGGHGGHLGFLIGTILAIFIYSYKSPWCFLPTIKSIGLLVQKKKRKIEFQDSRRAQLPCSINVRVICSCLSYTESQGKYLWFISFV